MTKEHQIEEALIKQLTELKYVYRSDIVDRKSLEQNFRTKFEALNRVRLSDNEFLRLREEIINPDVFVASKLLRERQYFQREDGTLAISEVVVPVISEYIVPSVSEVIVPVRK